MTTTVKTHIKFRSNIRQLKKNTSISLDILPAIAVWLTKNNNTVTLKEVTTAAIIFGITPTELKGQMALIGVKPVTQEVKEQTPNIWNPINEEKENAN
jgi:hypothetical protein